MKNAYRVLLTRVLQGMVIVVPEGDDEDPTREKEYYDATFEFLRNIGTKPLRQERGNSNLYRLLYINLRLSNALPLRGQPG